MSAMLCAAGLGLGFRTDNVWSVLERAALASAAISMPQGGAALLERRFADILQQIPSSDEAEVVPYVKPWEQDPMEAEDARLLEENPSNSSSPIPQKRTSDETPKALPLLPPQSTATSIPEKYQGALLQENLSSTAGVLYYDKASLKNYTEESDKTVQEIMSQGMPFSLELKGQPEILIVHTHATESFEPLDAAVFDTRNEWRTQNNGKNMVAVGERLAKTLQDYGISVLHDKTQHDYPSYNGAYERSAVTIQSYLDKYPSIKIVLDLHRDALLRSETTIVKPVVQTTEGKAAQIMIITGCEDGTMDVPKWRDNLRFATQVQNALELRQQDLTRPIFFCYRKYNMDKTTGSILLEFGGNANTLEEALLSAKLVGEAMGNLLNPTHNRPLLGQDKPQP